MVSGKTLINGNVPVDATVKLICNNVEISTEILDSKHNKFSFMLKSGNYYTIKIFRKKYVTRTISFDTFLPEGVKVTPIFKFNFEVELLPYKPKADNEYYDYPIAIIAYCPDRDVFDYNKNYTDIIKSKLSTGKTDFRAVHE
jgi:hypothetical protein